MKKLKYIITAFMLAQSLAMANFNDIYIADIQYDWINKNNVEKEAIISEVRDIIFEENELTKIKGFRSQFKDKLKDKNYKEHYFAASAGFKEYKDYNISAFYYKNKTYLYVCSPRQKRCIKIILL